MPEQLSSEQPITANKSSFIGRQAEKLSDHFWAWVFSGGLVIALAFISKRRAFLVSVFWHPRVPLIFVLLIAVPAVFALTLIVRRLVGRESERVFTVTDPQRSVIIETYDGATGTTFVSYSIHVTFANPSKSRPIIVFAYLEGTKPLGHFYEPIGIDPEQALIQVHLQGQCTMPRRIIRNRFRGRLVFVEVTGARFKEKVDLRYIPLPKDFKPPVAVVPPPQK